MSNAPLSLELLVPRLGEHLVEKGLIKPEELQRALEYQEALRQQGEFRLIGQILLDMDIITSETREAVVTERLTELRSALEEANKQLLAANQQLEKRVQERTAELQKAMEKLSELNQLKANIVANTSHELRTPLTHLKGYLELLLNGDLGPLTEQQQNALLIMDRSSDRLSRLIEDLILFSVSEREKLHLNISAIDISALCHASLDKVGQKARERKIQLVMESPDHLPKAEGDEEKISWVIMQFLDNAIKFTQPGGTVTLRIVQEKHQVTVSVLDTGIGIPDSRTDEIFDSFHQLDGSTTRRVGGTGLGLALAKKIIEAHGASIEVNSEMGKGSCFAFSLKTSQEPKST